ncbi:flagellar filament outer layer protein FlaA, putative [Olavius algarvensis spirochete endosymbiont]|uniref:flagellar filament outer layer protein FlaA n=1 Tax=Olavius algarvensis spirochete endosymbiont TaxID=260710 RepID=UPI000F1F7150|nr:flagellar filament outer layer protein FlaA [Olavius algarvensis spirochete endosymbiont]VDB00300.1 flagellar filament outer layer protein FlaA, putative [Olavius algarvensis spirochete endosymbiont]
MRSIFVLTLVLIACFGLYAQDESNAENLPPLTARESLKEISVNKMEDAGFWKGGMSSDFGLLQLRDFDGGSSDKQPIVAEEQTAEADDKVIGAKVSFLRRGVTEFVVKPIRPLPIEGIVKTVSVWVAGRNIEHELSLLILDWKGQTSVIPMGKLNHSGWKKMTVTIPPHIKQRDYHNYGYQPGISIEGFVVNCDIDETYGRYYIYFDDIRAVTDLFDEELQDPDDMLDAW